MSIFKEPQKPPKRDVQLKIMVTAEEKGAIDGAAERFEMTTSDLVREAVNRYVEWRESRAKSKRAR